MTDILQPPGRAIAYFPELTKITGSIKAAILCQQVIFETPREDGADIWISMREHVWIEETRLTLKEFRGAVSDLEERKLVRKHYDRANHVLQLQLQIENYNAAIQELGCGAPLKIAHAKKAHAKTAPAKRAHAKKEGGTLQNGTWHVPKGHFDINVVEAKGTTKEKEDTPPISPSPANADEITSSESPAGKFVAWWNREIVPLGGRSFSLGDADAKFITKANKALKSKSGATFWERVKQGFETSAWLRGEIHPRDGKRRFKATLPWLLSLHHAKGMANYVLVAAGEWTDDPEESHERKAISHDEVEL
jgi:hypothetical protein